MLCTLNIMLFTLSITFTDNMNFSIVPLITMSVSDSEYFYPPPKTQSPTSYKTPPLRDGTPH